MAQTRKYLLYISYIGSAFRGSQLQTLKEPSAPIQTVQNVVERGLKCLFELEGERPIRVNLASRTDAGVHALRAAITVSLPVFRQSDFIPPRTLVKLLNVYFSKTGSIRILEAYVVPDAFRFSNCKKEKTYLYRLGLLKQEFFGDQQRIIPILENNRTHLLSLNKKFDLKKAQEAAHLFEGVKDFGAVVGRPSKNIKPTICSITSFRIEESQPLVSFDPLSQKYNFYHFICKGDRFLYHMMRRMVCLTLGVGISVLNLDNIQKLFDEPVPSSWPRKGITNVPGFGLYLVDTNIDMEDFIGEEKFNRKTYDETHLDVTNADMIL